MKTTTQTVPSGEPKQEDDINEITSLTPFSSDDLKGEQFGRGNMLGGANPLESSTDAPWKK
jgi:hypothetical protein